jgi:uncharacterized membrane protein
MNLTDALIPSGWRVPGYVLGALIAWMLWRHTFWRRLKVRTDLNVFLAACVFLLLLWQLRAGVQPGLNFHLLGATLLTLMFGPWFALLGLSGILILTTAYHGGWVALPWNMLLMAVMPVSIAWGIYRFVDRRLPNHFFVYIFLNAFIGTALTVIALGGASTAFFYLVDAYPLGYLLNEYLPYFLLLMWSEAFSTGMAMTVLVVYKPQWVSTFDDLRYIRNK